MPAWRRLQRAAGRRDKSRRDTLSNLRPAQPWGRQVDQPRARRALLVQRGIEVARTKPPAEREAASLPTRALVHAISEALPLPQRCRVLAALAAPAESDSGHNPAVLRARPAAARRAADSAASARSDR